MASSTADDRGYGFAAFRSHAVNMIPFGTSGSWLTPGAMDCFNFTNSGDCECGAGYCVADEYHWHDDKGVCHNRVKCV